jgi:hypothetical protein
MPTSTIPYPPTATTDDDQIKFLYRVMELLRLDNNKNGQDFLDGKLSKDDWEKYKKDEFNPKLMKVCVQLNALKEKAGMYKINPLTDRTNPKLQLKTIGITESKWDIYIDLNSI